MPTFPGVYTTVRDNSFSNGLQSRFTCGLVGIASRGPFNMAVPVRNLSDFVTNFGASVSGSFLAMAVSSVTGAGGDGCRIVRVGTQYDATNVVGSGTSGSYQFVAPLAAQLTPNDYIRVSELGKASTVNARIQSISNGTVTMVSVGAEAVALQDTYVAATVSSSSVADSANKAESFLTAPTYGAALTAAGTVVGNKSDYSFTVSGNAAVITVGNVIKITQSGRATTREAQVRDVNTTTKVVTLEPVTLTNSGRQSVALQDNYTSGTIYVESTEAGQVAAQLQAATEGTWANTVGSTVGLTVTVSPGSLPDTKKFLIYQDGSLVETVDNLSYDSSSANYFITALASNAYINVLALLGSEPPGNTMAPWDLASFTPSNVATFADGFNGENVSAADYVGTILPADESATGLQIFNDNEAHGDLYVVAVPGVSDMGVFQQLALVASTINAFAVLDVPDNVNAREGIDYTNGQGLYADMARLDNYRAGFFWNWFETLNPFTGEEEFVPPSVGVLGDMSLTFDRYKPWYAAAGEVRGQLPGAVAVRYPRVREEVKQAMQGNGNVLNPILLYRGNSILIWGDLTTQRATSKLQAIHTVHLVNYIIKNMAAIARRYVFDPNDPILLSQLTLEYTNFLDTVKTERGVEAYQLTCNGTNNTAATRNQKTVVVDLAIIPIDVAEKININVTVNSSGAVLNAITNGIAI